MGTVQIVTTVLAAAVTVVAVVLDTRTFLRMISVIRLGQPDPERFTDKGTHARIMAVKTLGQTRILRWCVVGAAP